TSPPPRLATSPVVAAATKLATKPTLLKPSVGIVFTTPTARPVDRPDTQLIHARPVTIALTTPTLKPASSTAPNPGEPPVAEAKGPTTATMTSSAADIRSACSAPTSCDSFAIWESRKWDALP